MPCKKRVVQKSLKTRTVTFNKINNIFLLFYTPLVLKNLIFHNKHVHIDLLEISCKKKLKMKLQVNIHVPILKLLKHVKLKYPRH